MKLIQLNTKISILVKTLNNNGNTYSVNVYNSEWSDKAYFGYASSASADYTLPSTTVNRINSINETGFVLNRATSTSNTQIKYIAY